MLTNEKNLDTHHSNDKCVDALHVISLVVIMQGCKFQNIDLKNKVISMKLCLYVECKCLLVWRLQR